jgi:hypothetical protein
VEDGEWRFGCALWLEIAGLVFVFLNREARKEREGFIDVIGGVPQGSSRAGRTVFRGGCRLERYGSRDVN